MAYALSDNDVDWAETARIMADILASERGYVDFFPSVDKPTRTWAVAQSFCEALDRRGGLKITGGEQHPFGASSAPDYELYMHNGETWGCAIADLISRQVTKLAKKGRSPLTYWTDAELVAEFERRVAKKDKPGKVKPGDYDRYLLLVHVDDMILPAERLATVLGARVFQTRLIDHIYVLVSYDPRVQWLPLLHLSTSKGRSDTAE